MMYEELKRTQQELEEEILNIWDKEDTFRKSLKLREGALSFVFYEGPPTANGRPGIHHIFARTLKDIVCRYRTMKGFYVERKAGWDTHGLPVEREVELELGLKCKADITKLGVDKFNRFCRESVFKYKAEWEAMTRRIGYWLDLEHPYITCDRNYIESVWWLLSEIWKNGLIYKDYKILPYCPRCGTGLSDHEESLGYEEVEDPSLFVKMELEDEAETYFLVWTTTPWTLLSNVALAVHPDANYVRVELGKEKFILARPRLEDSLNNVNYNIIEEFQGKLLLGKCYKPLYRFANFDEKAYYVIGSDFVSMEDGTGIVHIAP
ncbi:MAG: class I tRNA ligase family protein, partial [bacterium]